MVELGSSIKSKVIITTQRYFSTGMCYVALSRAVKLDNCRFIGKWDISTLNMNSISNISGKSKIAFFMHKEWIRQLKMALNRIKTNMEITIMRDSEEEENYIDSFIELELSNYS